MDWSMYIPGLSFVMMAIGYIGWQITASILERKQKKRISPWGTLVNMLEACWFRISGGQRRERAAELAAHQEAEIPGLIKGARGVISRLENDIDMWEHERHTQPLIQSPEIRDQHKSWQADFDAADAPARARAIAEAEAKRQERINQRRRKEQLQRQLERDEARQKLADFRLIALNEAQLQTMALGYALFRIGAKLIQEELYEDEDFALTCYLNYTRRNGHPFREDVSVRAWDGTELWQH